MSALSIGAGLFAADWIAGAAIAALWLGYKLLVFPGSTPVLILAFAFQWLQVTIGVFYHAISGRELLTMFSSDYRPMVLIGLASVATFAIGIRAGVQLAWRNRTPGHAWPEQALSWPVLIVAYVVMLSSETAIREFAWDNASITQAVLAVDMARLGVLFLMFRRLTRPSIRWHLVGLLLAVEIVMGFIGFFAGFREPLILVVLAILEVLDRFSHPYRVGWLGQARRRPRKTGALPQAPPLHSRNAR